MPGSGKDAHQQTKLCSTRWQWHGSKELVLHHWCTIHSRSHMTTSQLVAANLEAFGGQHRLHPSLHAVLNVGTAT